jgi:dihydroorotate dehydrogenase electron transfer subunit
MTNASVDAALRCSALVLSNKHVSSGLIRLDLELEQKMTFEPGQFAMINLPGPSAFVFSRPFSILDVQDQVVSLLYRVVGRGTRAMQQCQPGDALSFLGPLGQPFGPPPDNHSVVVIGGGVGLPPVWAWLKKYGRSGDAGYFGARDGADVPWDLLDDSWHVSVDTDQHVPDGRKAWQGLVPDLVAREIFADDDTPRLLMSCGPIPLLKAVADLADARRWQCLVSLEEHMGCGYGACKGCVVPVVDPAADEGWRNATCCQEGPVFRAESIDWSRYGKKDFEVVG